MLPNLPPLLAAKPTVRRSPSALRKPTAACANLLSSLTWQAAKLSRAALRFPQQPGGAPQVSPKRRIRQDGRPPAIPSRNRPITTSSNTAVDAYRRAIDPTGRTKGSMKANAPSNCGNANITHPPQRQKTQNKQSDTENGASTDLKTNLAPSPGLITVSKPAL